MYYEQELENRVTGLATLMVAVPGNRHKMVLCSVTL